MYFVGSWGNVAASARSQLASAFERIGKRELQILHRQRIEWCTMKRFVNILALFALLLCTAEAARLRIGLRRPPRGGGEIPIGSRQMRISIGENDAGHIENVIDSEVDSSNTTSAVRNESATDNTTQVQRNETVVESASRNESLTENATEAQGNNTERSANVDREDKAVVETIGNKTIAHALENSTKKHALENITEKYAVENTTRKQERRSTEKKPAERESSISKLNASSTEKTSSRSSATGGAGNVGPTGPSSATGLPGNLTYPSLNAPLLDGNSSFSQVNKTMTSSIGAITRENVHRVNLIKNLTLTLDPYTLGMEFEARMIGGKRRVVITKVEKDSDAAIAKFEVGDILIALNGNYLNKTSNGTLGDFIFSQIRQGVQAKRMSARILKADKTLRTIKFPVRQGWAAYGITFMVEPDRKYSCNQSKNELLIANVVSDSPADKKGLTPGDVVITINHVPSNGLLLENPGNISKGTSSLHIVTMDKSHYNCSNVNKIKRVAKVLLRKKVVKMLHQIMMDYDDDKIDNFFVGTYARWISKTFSKEEMKGLCLADECRAELKEVRRIAAGIDAVEPKSVEPATTNGTNSAEEEQESKRCERLKKQCDAEKADKIMGYDVCGSNHVTYSRECEFLVAQCEASVHGIDIDIEHNGKCEECREVTLEKRKTDHDKGFAFFGLRFKTQLQDMKCGTFPRVQRVKDGSPASRISHPPRQNEVVTKVNGKTLCNTMVADLKNEMKTMGGNATFQLCTPPKNINESKICNVCPEPEFRGCKYTRIDRPFSPWGLKLKKRHTVPHFEVMSVLSEKAGASGGVQRGDLILRIDEEDMSTVEDKEIIHATALNAGKKMVVEVRRKGKLVTLNLERNLTDFKSNLVDGLKLDLQPMFCAGFPTISKIEKFTQAQKLGLAEQDVIFSINGNGLCNQNIADSGIDFSGMESLNIQTCDLKEMSRSLKIKMCKNFCPPVSEESVTGVATGPTGVATGPGAVSSSSASSGPASSGPAGDLITTNDGYLITQEVRLNGFTTAQVVTHTKVLKSTIANVLNISEKFVMLDFNESTVDDESFNFIELSKVTSQVQITLKVFVAGKNTSTSKVLSTFMNGNSFKVHVTNAIAEFMGIAAERMTLTFGTAQSDTVTVTYGEDGSVVKIEQNNEDKIPGANSTKVENVVPPVLKEVDNATSPPMPAIEKLNQTNSPFIDMLLRKRLRFGINFAAAVTKSLRFFEVRKVFDRVKNINLVKYGDVLDKINGKRVDEFGDDGTMDKVLMEANTAVLDMERRFQNGEKQILRINVTKVDFEPIQPEAKYLKTKCGEFPIIKSLTARIKNTKFESLIGQVVTVVNGNHICRLSKDRVDALLYEPIDVYAEIVPLEFARENENNEFCKHLDCYRPPPPPMPVNIKYEVCKLGYYCSRGKCPEGARKVDNYCAYMPTTHEDYLSTSHICIPGHYCPPKHQCPVGFELYNANQKGFCFDIQPMGPYTAPHYVGREALWMNGPVTIAAFYNHSHNATAKQQ